MKIGFDMKYAVMPMFGELQQGECFIYGDTLFMKVEEIKPAAGVVINAIEIDRGRFTSFAEEDCIKPMQCKVMEDWD